MYAYVYRLGGTEQCRGTFGESTRMLSTFLTDRSCVNYSFHSWGQRGRDDSCIETRRRFQLSRLRRVMAILMTHHSRRETQPDAARTRTVGLAGARGVSGTPTAGWQCG